MMNEFSAETLVFPAIFPRVYAMCIAKLWLSTNAVCDAFVVSLTQ